MAIGCCLAPAYFSFLILESSDTDSYRKYLLYWIIYALLEVIAPLLTKMLPSLVYILLRIGIAVGLLHPESSVAGQIYDKILHPFLEKF